MEQGVLDLNPFISVRLAQQLQTATNHSSKLYGNDIYIAQQLVNRILEHDSNANGFNLTHRHDKNFIKVLIVWIIDYWFVDNIVFVYYYRILSVRPAAYFKCITSIFGGPLGSCTEAVRNYCWLHSAITQPTWCVNKTALTLCLLKSSLLIWVRNRDIRFSQWVCWNWRIFRDKLSNKQGKIILFFVFFGFCYFFQCLVWIHWHRSRSWAMKYKQECTESLG